MMRAILAGLLVLSAPSWASATTLAQARAFRDGLQAARARVEALIELAADGRDENDDQVIPLLLAASSSLFTAGERLDAAVAAFLRQDRRQGETQTIRACTAATRAQIDVMRARLATLSPPAGVYGPHGDELMAIREEILLNVAAAGCEE